MSCFYVLFITMIWISPILTQFCMYGSSVAKGPGPCNFTAGDQCITGLLKTQAAPGIYIPGYTEFYICGPPTSFLYLQSRGVLSNVTYCNTTFCNNVTRFPVPTNNTCETVITEAGCVNRSDCYFCKSFLGSPLGYCKNRLGYPAPCFAVSLAMPQPICSSIGCYNPYPYQTPNNTRMTKDYLYAFGFPNPGVSPSQGNFTTLIAVDVTRRVVRTINESYRTTGFCNIDQDLQHWCGLNTSTTTFKYCLASDTWPQLDVWGWIQNTTYTNNKGLNPFFPSFCACPIDGRAYYIPVNQIYPDPYFGTACNAEWAWLALWILLMILSCLVFIFVLYDTFVLIYLQCTSKESKISIGSQTLWAKICMILYFLVTIPDQGLIISPHTTAQLESTQLLLRLLGIIFILYSFVIAVFTFVEILLGCKVFGQNKAIQSFLPIFKWAFFAFNTVLLICCLFLASAYGYYVEKLQDFRVSSIQEFQSDLKISQGLGQTICLLLICIQFIMIIVTGLLLGFISHLIWTKSGNLQGQKYIKQLAVRLIGLCAGVLFAIPNLAIFIIISWILAWVLQSAAPSAWPSGYETSKAFDWFIWAELMTELLWISAIAYSMRTVVKHSIFYNRMKSVFGSTTAGSKNSQNLSSTSRKGSSSTNTAGMDVKSG